MHNFCKSKHIFLHRCHSVWKMYQISNIFGISLLKLSLESVKGQKFKIRLIFMTYLGLNYKSFISTLSKNQFFFFKHIFLPQFKWFVNLPNALKAIPEGKFSKCLQEWVITAVTAAYHSDGFGGWHSICYVNLSRIVVIFVVNNSPTRHHVCVNFLAAGPYYFLALPLMMGAHWWVTLQARMPKENILSLRTGICL